MPIGRSRSASGRRHARRMLEGVGIDEHLGRSVDLNLTFIAERRLSGRAERVFSQGQAGDSGSGLLLLPDAVHADPERADGRRCARFPWTPGKEYEVVTISIDPHESFDLARKKKAIYLSSFDRPAPGWHFLSDHDGNAKKLAEQIGFNYRYDRTHAAVRARGGDHDADAGRQDGAVSVRRALPVRAICASRLPKLRKIARPWRSRRFCCSAITTIRKPAAMSCSRPTVMRVGGVLTVLLIAFFLWRMFRAERKRDRGLKAGDLKRELHKWSGFVRSMLPPQGSAFAARSGLRVHVPVLAERRCCSWESRSRRFISPGAIATSPAA